MVSLRTGKIISDAATAANFAMAWLYEPLTKTEELAERFGLRHRIHTSYVASYLGLPPRRRGPKPQQRREN